MAFSIWHLSDFHVPFYLTLFGILFDILSCFVRFHVTFCLTFYLANLALYLTYISDMLASLLHALSGILSDKYFGILSLSGILSSLLQMLSDILCGMLLGPSEPTSFHHLAAMFVSGEHRKSRSLCLCWGLVSFKGAVTLPLCRGTRNDTLQVKPHGVCQPCRLTI